MDEEIKEEPIAKSELEICQEKCNEYLNSWKRSAADFANYKKEEIERMAMLGNYAKENMLFDILPVIDSIYLAQAHVPAEIKENNWMTGFSQIQNQIADFLKKEGIEEIGVLGKPFDHNCMESLGEIEGGQSPGTVVEELQKGYKIGEKVLRPAKVKISK